jgi:hypothetical protein
VCDATGRTKDMVRRRRREHRRGALLLVVVVAGAGLGACASPAEPDPGAAEEIATVEPIEGTDLSTVTLSEVAVERLGLATDVVRDADVRGQRRTVVPYSAVVYDPEGATFAYETSEPRVFVRTPVAIEFIDGDLAVLTAGPPAGTSVATVGVSELLGTEYGVGGE